MKIAPLQCLESTDHVGCFGAYRKNDPICKKLCALNLKCAIEFDQTQRIEILEDLVSSEGLFIRIQ